MHKINWAESSISYVRNINRSSSSLQSATPGFQFLSDTKGILLTGDISAKHTAVYGYTFQSNFQARTIKTKQFIGARKMQKC